MKILKIRLTQRAPTPLEERFPYDSRSAMHMSEDQAISVFGVAMTPRMPNVTLARYINNMLSLVSIGLIG